MQCFHITILLRTTGEDRSCKKTGVEVESGIMYGLLEQSNPLIRSNTVLLLLVGFGYMRLVEGIQ